MISRLVHGPAGDRFLTRAAQLAAVLLICELPGAFGAAKINRSRSPSLARWPRYLAFRSFDVMPVFFGQVATPADAMARPAVKMGFHLGLWLATIPRAITGASPRADGRAAHLILRVPPEQSLLLLKALGNGPSLGRTPLQERQRVLSDPPALDSGRSAG